LLRHFATRDPVIANIVSITDQSYEQTPANTTAFEMLARSIASQQLSGVVARKIIGRLIAMHGGRFPEPAQLAAAAPASLRAVGFSFAKIAALQDLAAHTQDGRLPPDEQLGTLDDETIIEHCVAVRGIGRWTVQMLLMFHFARPDVMPADDFGVRNGFRLAYGLKGLPRPKALLAYAERWKPYRSAAAWYLWRAVELHRLGRLPKRAGRAPRVAIVKPKPAPRRTARKSKPVSRPAGRKSHHAAARRASSKAARAPRR
jgi:DNA-3-methyladenine glycosylase II